MASHSPTDEPLLELKHDAVPGYMRVFLIAFAVMTLYLALILIVSPGKAEKHHGGHDDKHHESH
ncbi:MAG: hypothetical protein QNK82_11985 [Akkermansiaceae bacterium]|jgi:hypothetical protein